MIQRPQDAEQERSEVVIRQSAVRGFAKRGVECRTGRGYPDPVGPTVFKWKGYRFFFFSREERRPHVHAMCSDGEAKFWLDPTVELAKNHGMSSAQVSELKMTVEDRKHDILDAWRKHFAG